jgi:preprotein translocase subunit SecY
MLLKKIGYTLLILLVIRIGNLTPISGINEPYLYDEIKTSFAINMYNTFFKGQSTFGIFTLGIIPNINSSMVMQYLTSNILFLKKMQKQEGERGKNKIIKYTRYLTLFIALIWSFSIAINVKPYVFDYDGLKFLQIGLTITTGSIIMMWFSEVLTEIGIGNGTSLIIYMNVTSTIPPLIKELFIVEENFIYKILTLGFLFLCIIGVAIIQNAAKIIPIISTKALMEDQSMKNNFTNLSYMPFRLTPAGVIPVIFAASAVGFITYTLGNFPIFEKILDTNLGHILSTFVYFSLIVVCNILYSRSILNASEIAEDLNKMGFIINSLRPGSQTKQYLKQIINRLTLMGGILLGYVAITLNLIGYLNPEIVSLNSLGATAVLIAAGVAIDVNRQIRGLVISDYYNNII